MIITIFRIENSQGMGPYFGPHKNSWKDPDHDDRVPLAIHQDLWRSYPEIQMWCESSEDNYPDALKYGFKNVQQLEEWFSQNELLRLKSFGFEVVERQARVIFDLDKQIVFAPNF